MLRVILILVPIVVTIYALFDAINTPSDDTRWLPRWAWIVAILALIIVGPVMWFFLGKPWRRRGGGPAGGGGGGDLRPLGPDDDPDFLSELERRKRNL